MVDEREHFPLTRYFVATGLVTAVVVALVLAVVSASEIQADLLRESEDNAVHVARSLNLHIHRRFLDPTIARDGYVDLERPEHFRALDDVVRLAIAEFDVQAVYLFDLEGRILYSTNSEHRGFKVHDNPNYARAAHGEVSSIVMARGSPLDVSGQPGSTALLESYVPIHRLDAAGAPHEQTGVIEVYQDATDHVSESRRASARVALISTVGVVALMLALWLWIRTADRLIRERAAALVEANARLAELSADLERQVQDRTRRLVRAETLASLGTLGAGVAHEVNNPVAAIASCAEGLLRRAKAEALVSCAEFADFPEYLEIIRDEAFRVKGITQNLLDFSRAGQGGPRRDSVDLKVLLEAGARLFAHRAADASQRIEVEAVDTVRIRGDAAALRQLVLNLTVNALDASAKGGVVRWTLRGDGAGGAELVCSDDGPGFPPDALEHALEPFYTQRPTGEGTGLGLSIAYGIARQHDGTIELGNGPTGGARVVVKLGAGPDAGAAAPSGAGGSGE